MARITALGGKSACAATLFMLLSSAAALSAQQEVTLFAEPVAAGMQYVTPVAGGVSIGASASVGPLYGVTVSDANVTDVRNWATAYAVLAFRASGSIQLLVSPIGGALVAGNDFGAVYPSAQAGLELLRRRWRIGTAIRVIRIAGANDSGTYWTQWVPVRIGYSLTRPE